MFSDTSWVTQEERSGEGEIIFISLDGHAPVKTDYFIDAPIPDIKGGIYYLRVALPKFVIQPDELDHVEVKLFDSGGLYPHRRCFLQRTFLQ